jgi:hypothetical protein
MDDLYAFFGDRGFIKSDEHLFKLDNTHLLRVFVVQEIDSNVEKEKRKLFGDQMFENFYLLVDDKFDKFVFLQDQPIRKVTYEKSRQYAPDTEKSLLDKINAIQFEATDYNKMIEDLFNVRAIEKFYEDYKEKRESLAKMLGGNETHAQIILDRIIFIYFLQAKRIVPEHYLLELYGKSIAEDKNYYDDYLNTLFFEVFNKEQKYRIESVRAEFDTIPYLNGGLFSSHEFENSTMNINNDFWKGLFDMFEGYDWILIDEEKNESITPSVLGHIYEKSVSQKETGSYYTPEVITSYICENTIIPRLTDKVNKKFGTDYKNIETELLDDKNLDREKIDRILYLYFEGLKTLTVLDPACGSGAFLYAGETILFRLYGKCFDILARQNEFKDEYDTASKFSTINYYLKREIITKNIYGVDIQEGCVEIAKLRLWLSMISEMEAGIGQIEPLPNIDYNIMVGNSLIGLTEIPELQGSEITNYFDNTHAKFKELERLKNQYRREKSSIKAKELRNYIQKEIEDIRTDLDDIYAKKLDLEIELPPLDVKKLMQSGGKKDIREAVADIHDNYSLTNFKIVCKKPNDLDGDAIRSHDGVTCYQSRKTGLVTSIYPTPSFKFKGTVKSFPDRLLSWVDDWDCVKRIEFEKKMSGKDLRDLKAFHWVIEFYEVFND